MKLSAGKILLSTPELLMDHIFNQSIILLTEHNKKETMGFMINKPMPLRLDDLFNDIPLNFQIWNGGPVETGSLFYIHNISKLPDAILFDKKNELYIGGDFQILKKMLLNTEIDENNIKFFLGYTGWHHIQIQEEIEENAWVIMNNNINLFHLNPKNIWKEKLVEHNPKNIVWKNAPLNPNLN